MDKEKLIEYLESMKPWEIRGEDDTYIPEPPNLRNDPGGEFYKTYVIPNFHRCGAIPKSSLIPGHLYLGSCRNSGKAIWYGDHFTYSRHKFGSTYQEDINDFEDDDGYDLFVPVKELNMKQDEFEKSIDNIPEDYFYSSPDNNRTRRIKFHIKAAYEEGKRETIDEVLSLLGDDISLEIKDKIKNL